MTRRVGNVSLLHMKSGIIFCTAIRLETESRMTFYTAPDYRIVAKRKPTEWPLTY
ncbi:hypothetical protein X772_15905 [Mesorhizobium sp. LSJC280B00]|nr:hypothetical protein X772_15905 [Mesorhizobium sp. LSJC280B00]